MLKTLEEALHEAIGGNIDLAMGYSILKDIFKRQNFSVESAKYVGKKKIVFMYLDPEFKDPKKEKKLSLEFSFKDVSEKEFKDMDRNLVRTPVTSFVSNKYGKEIRLVAEKNGYIKKSDADEKSRLKVLSEKQTIGKECYYIFVVENYNDTTGEFISALQIDIVAKK